MGWHTSEEQRAARNQRTGKGGGEPEPEGRRQELERSVGMIEKQRQPGAQQQLDRAMEAARSAARGAVAELSSARRSGYTMPTTDALLDAHAGGLGSGRRWLREFLDEIRPWIERGEYGSVDEAARVFALDVGEKMAASGWTPSPAAREDPAELAESVARARPQRSS